jgi:O-acetyl-ADP-ribose deacetylase (regulator of RNase III)
MSRESGSQEIRELYYITHKDNLASILKNGILSHDEINRRGIEYARVYNEDIVSARGEKKAPDGRSLWEFANLFFQPRNPMMYRVIDPRTTPNGGPQNIVVVGVRRSVLHRNDIYITNGNAANNATIFYPGSEFGRLQPSLMKDIDKKFWKKVDGSKRKIMAECLVPKAIRPDYIEEVFAPNSEVAAELRTKFRDPNVHVIPEPEMFFEPTRLSQVTDNLSVIEGDMFFSRMQTLTVSVNCMGVMGKGVASRAKYQFPDVYKYYQDACRKKSLRMGRPVLYKRQQSFEDDVVDQPQPMTEGVGETWFLLFATKDRWWDKSNAASIEEGLIWLGKNYKTLGIKSLALPALGCGLGGLDWKDIGPMLCRNLALDIPVQIHLPTEKLIPDEYIQKDFLLFGVT